MSGVKVSFLEAGFTEHLEAISLKGGRLKKIHFPATVAVIEHPREGVILFDTGYSARFFEQTKYFPNKFYSLITPVTILPEHTALAQLHSRGISTRDVRKVILSHFHADHIGGAGDFPYAEFICRDIGYTAVKDLGSWGALMAGFLKGLLPSDFEGRVRFLTDRDFRAGNYGFRDFELACDLFGDGSVVIVDLPGHATGQIGAMVRDQNGSRFLMVADACWGERAYRENRMPHGITKLLFSSWEDYRKTLSKIQSVHHQDAELKIVPCHCDQTLASLQTHAHP